MRLFIFLALLGFCLAERTRYDSYEVWELSVQNAEQANFMMKLQEKNLVDFGGLIPRHKSMQMAVPPQHAAVVKNSLLDRNMPFTVVISNLQEIVEKEFERLDAKKTPGVYAYDPNDFNTLADTYDHFADYVNSCAGRGLTCSLIDIGDSYEGRPIYVVSVGTGGNNPIVWMDATTHAREWLSTTTVVRIFDMLIEEYGSNADVTDMLNSYDFYMLPIVNPDGYSYTWTNSRYWRKNRRPISGCTGVDLNRNFASYGWGEQGVSHSPCSDIYCGPSAGSEPEVQAQQNYMLTIESRIKTSIHFHSYYYMWSFPWGFTEDFTDFTPCVRPANFNNLNTAAAAAVRAIEAYSGDDWLYGTGCEIVYPTTGSTDDWTMSQTSVQYVYLPELRGNDFVVPPDQIEPSKQEVWAGIVAQVRAIESIEGR